MVVLASRNHKMNLEAMEATGCLTVPLDVSSIESVRDVFAEIRPNVVIHAAATKFVDLSERAPMECIDINVTGSQNVARVAIEANTSVVLGISTDKAAPPVMNTYALSKALMERMFCTLDSKAATSFACVRFGNIAWSTGSVLPQWKAMHEAGEIIRTTGPEMYRFFVSIDEAVDVVRTGLEAIEEIHGKILTRSLKVAQIKDLLDVWKETRGGSWTDAPRRLGDSDHEALVGHAEAPYTREVWHGGLLHFEISFNQPVEDHLEGGITSEGAERFDRSELIRILEATRE